MNTPFVRYYRTYAKAHRTTGCRITHMLGIPAVFIAIIALFVRPKVSLFAIGFAHLMQVLGHYGFERNNPLLLQTKDPTIVPVALLFQVREWQALFSGRFKNRAIRRKVESRAPLKAVAKPDSMLEETSAIVASA